MAWRVSPLGGSYFAALASPSGSNTSIASRSDSIPNLIARATASPSAKSNIVIGSVAEKLERATEVDLIGRATASTSSKSAIVIGSVTEKLERATGAAARTAPSARFGVSAHRRVAASFFANTSM